MTKRITYTATFPDGRQLVRKSHRTYTHAYRWTGENADGTLVGGTGFAGTRDLAAKAAAREQSYLLNVPTIRGGRTLAYVKYMNEVIAAWKPGKVWDTDIVAVERN